MAREDREMQARTEGMVFALKIAKEKGIDELEKEIRFRVKTGISLNTTLSDVNKASARIKEVCCDTFLILSIAAIHDTYGFGQKRVQRFIDTFMKGADYLADDLATWDDYIQEIKEQMNLQMEIRWNR